MIPPNVTTPLGWGGVELKFKAHSRGETILGNGSGPAGVWVRIGAKVLLDICAFDRWVASHRLGGAK